MQFGPDYIIPKPFDRRVLIWEASAVAKAAVDEGIARISPEEFSVSEYREELESRLGMSYSIMRHMINQVRGRGKRIVFPEGDNEKVLGRHRNWLSKEYVSQFCWVPRKESTLWWRN